MAKPIALEAHGMKSLRSAYFYSLAGTFVVSAMGAVSGILCARILGTTGRGELALLILLPALTIQFGSLGLIQASAYLASPGRASGLIASSGIVVALLLGVTESAALLPFLPLILPALPPAQFGTVWLCMLIIPFTYSNYVLLGLDLGRGAFLRYSLYQALPPVLWVFCLLLVSLMRKASPSRFAEALVWAWVGVLLLRLPDLIRAIRVSRPSGALIGSLVRQGTAFALPDLAALALVRIDYPLLVHWVSTADLGLYAVALAVGTGQALTASPISQVCFQLTSSNSGSEDGLSMLARQFRLFQIVFAAVAVIAAFTASALIRIAFGSQFAPAIPAARVLIVTMSFWSCSQLLDNGMRGLGWQKLATSSNVAGVTVVIALAAPAVGHFGIRGMAGVMCLGQMVSLATKMVLLRIWAGANVRQFWALDRSGMSEVCAVSFRQARGMWSALRYLGRKPALPEI